MKSRLWIVALLFIFTLKPVFAGMSDEEVLKKPSAEVEAGLPADHPAHYYIYAMRLFKEGRKDDAVFWFYVGQLRFRFHLNANPKLSRSGDPALMASLNSVVGQPINEYAGGDTNMWSAQIERALKWDDETDNGFTSKVNFKEQWQEIRTGLASLPSVISKSADDIRQKREKAGLPNR